MSDDSYGTTFGPSSPGAINLASGDTGDVDTSHMANNPSVATASDPNADLTADGKGGFSLISDAQPYYDARKRAAGGELPQSARLPRRARWLLRPDPRAGVPGQGDQHTAAVAGLEQHRGRRPVRRLRRLVRPPGIDDRQPRATPWPTRRCASAAQPARSRVRTDAAATARACRCWSSRRGRAADWHLARIPGSFDHFAGFPRRPVLVPSLRRSVGPQRHAAERRGVPPGPSHRPGSERYRSCTSPTS